MRRGFSIYLILFLGLGPLSALLNGSEDASLPACCRRHGAHHCAMNRQMMAHLAPDPRPSLSAPTTCPLYPGPNLGICAPAPALAAEKAGMRADFRCRCSPSLTEAAAHSRTNLTHAGRGPPAPQQI